MLINFDINNINKLDGKAKLNRKSVITGCLIFSLLLSGCNRSVFDTKYGFNRALVFGEDSAVVMDVEQWKDYSGEQIQLVTEDNFVLLTSSFDTNCFYGNSNRYSIDDVANGAVVSQEVHYLTEKKEENVVYNKDFWDSNWSFNKVVTFNGNNALILPVGQWKDYSGEQLQVVTKDGLILVLSSYNSKLVCDSESSINAFDFAQSYVGSDGKVLDLSINNSSDFNYDIWDTVRNFNKAIIMKDDSCVIVPIVEWVDYEGEQLQLKIKDGPTIVTAAYDTILLNDINSETKAIDVANGLSSNVIDLADGYNEEGLYNKTIIDLNYGFSNAIISNDNSSTALKIDKWNDYEGEQLQIKLSSGDVILTSSMMLDLVNGGSSSINASELSKMYISKSGKNIDYSKGDKSSYVHNKYVFDMENSFRYALKIIDGNVTIIPLKKWTDFYNNDGGTNEEDSPNCEQIQLVLPDDTVIVTTAYDTVLVKNINDIYDIAEMFRGENGVISDLTSYVGEPVNDRWNISWFDTKYHFDTAILCNGKTTQVLPIKNWLDFSEGEQLQINFNDDTGVLTSFVNTSLIDPATSGIEEVIAKAFSGSLDKNEGLVKIYK